MEDLCKKIKMQNVNREAILIVGTKNHVKNVGVKTKQKRWEFDWSCFFTEFRSGGPRLTQL